MHFFLLLIIISIKPTDFNILSIIGKNSGLSESLKCWDNMQNWKTPHETILKQFYRFLHFPPCYTPGEDDKNVIPVSHAQCLESFLMGAGISRLPELPHFTLCIWVCDVCVCDCWQCVTCHVRGKLRIFPFVDLLDLLFWRRGRSLHVPAAQVLYTVLPHGPILGKFCSFYNGYTQFIAILLSIHFFHLMTAAIFV